MPDLDIKIIRFSKVIYLAFGLGILTNLYIASLFIYISAEHVLWSPLLGSLIFILAIILSLKKILSIKSAYFAAAYSVAIEVSIHTYFIGWNAGFFYYLFLLPLTFLMYPEWKKSTTLIFNLSIISLTFFLWYSLRNEEGLTHSMPEFENFLNQFNLAIVGIVILITTIYFSNVNRLQDTALVKANKDLEIQNKEISEQHQHVQILLKEIHHRVKNNLQIITSLLSMQRRATNDEGAINILDESRRRVEAIALIHQKLYSDIHGNQVDFKSYLSELVNSQQLIQSNIECHLESIDVLLDLDTAVPLGLIISELITNSVKHAFKETKNPKVYLTLTRDSNSLELTYTDNGSGLPDNFDLTVADSLGMEIISALIDQIDASIEFKNENGACFKINFLV
ncbi:sensor histidine kinase [Crocinitomix catalasitica]|uniref:sensor histidine kinase n=1 Tax=Crocinitomix catalasitica TaxID=184607 RepID=UPI000480D21A|nr:sensor histidine kinase [Crocinitomix catalasitica]